MSAALLGELGGQLQPHAAAPRAVPAALVRAARARRAAPATLRYLVSPPHC